MSTQMDSEDEERKVRGDEQKEDGKIQSCSEKVVRLGFRASRQKRLSCPNAVNLSLPATYDLSSNSTVNSTASNSSSNTLSSSNAAHLHSRLSSSFSSLSHTGGISGAFSSSSFIVRDENRIGGNTGGGGGGGGSRMVTGKLLIKSLFNDLQVIRGQKLNTRNAFEFDLIDTLSKIIHNQHFHPMQTEDRYEHEEDINDDEKKKKEERENELTFTSVSSAIEGASKVYGYRVEAIYDQTYHVWNMMTHGRVHDAYEGEKDEECKKKKKNDSSFFQENSFFFLTANPSHSTIAPKSDITETSIPTDTLIDPYFMKMSGMFDQAGARGLLLSNLELGRNLQLKLNGSDPITHISSFSSHVSCPCPEKMFRENLDCSLLKNLVLGEEDINSVFNLDACVKPIEHFRRQIRKLRGERDVSEDEACDIGNTNKNAIVDDFLDQISVHLSDESISSLAMNSKENDRECGLHNNEKDYDNSDEKKSTSSSILPSSSSSYTDDHYDDCDSFNDNDISGLQKSSLTESCILDKSLGLDSMSADLPTSENFEYFSSLLPDINSFQQSLLLHRFSKKNYRRNLSSRVKGQQDSPEDFFFFNNQTKKDKKKRKRKNILIIDPFVVNLKDLHKKCASFPSLKYDRSSHYQNRLIDNIFIAADFTSYPFTFSPLHFSSLSTIPSKQFRLKASTRVSIHSNTLSSTGAAFDRNDSSNEYFWKAEIVDFNDNTQFPTIYQSVDCHENDDFHNESPFELNTDSLLLNVKSNDSSSAYVLGFVDEASTISRGAGVIKKSSKVCDSELVLSRPSKYVDVGVVKSAVRMVLAIGDDKKNTISKKGERHMSFHRVVNQTKENLPTQERDSCSPQMLFVCLLYTCNDQDLILKKTDEGFNVIVGGSDHLHFDDDDDAEIALSILSRLPDVVIPEDNTNDDISTNTPSTSASPNIRRDKIVRNKLDREVIDNKEMKRRKNDF